MMMGASSGHGARLTREEYEKRIVDLYSGDNEQPSRQEELRLAKAELDLLIDYRLGKDFPTNRRLALWRAKQNQPKIFSSILLAFSRTLLEMRMERVAELLLKRYREILSIDEFRQLFGGLDDQSDSSN